MKKLLPVVTLALITSFSYSQDSTITTLPPSTETKAKKDWSKVVIDQAGDHFMIAFTGDLWSGAPDSINNLIKGFSRGLNVAIMLNKPFKSDPRWSVAL